MARKPIRFNSPDRRSFVKSLGATGAVALAGCTGTENSGSGNGENTSDDVTETSESSGDSGTTTLRFWTLFTGGDGAAMKNLVDKFNDEHDDIQIERERQPFDQYYDKLYTSMTGGSPPDLAAIHNSKQLNFTDGLYSLDDRVDAEPYVDSVWERTAPTGQHYGLPLGTFAYGLYYNKDIFEEAGLDPESPPTNYEELESVANTITEETDKLAFNPNPYATYNYTFTAWIRAMGEELFNDDNSSAAFDTETGRALGQYYHDVAEKWDKPDSSASRGIKDFRSGNLAMTLNGTWFQLVLRDTDLNWGFGKPWVVPNMEENLTWGGTHLISIPQKPDQSEERTNKAVQAAEWLTQESEIWATQAGHVPAVEGVTESDAITSSEVWDLTLEQYVEMVQDDQIAYWPVIENRADYERPLDQIIAQIYDHKLEPAEGIEQAAQEIANNLQS